MITLTDCEAFCDADPAWVDELACRECLGMVQACARAHGATLSANDAAMLPERSAAADYIDHRFAA